MKTTKTADETQAALRRIGVAAVRITLTDGTIAWESMTDRHAYRFVEGEGTVDLGWAADLKAVR